MSASVISCVDAPPVLEACEQVFDPVSLPVKDSIVAVLNTMFGMGRDAGCDAALDECLAEGSRAIGAVGQQVAGRRQGFDDCGSGLVIVGLPLAQMQQQWAPLAVADHLQLGG